jgi:hypothetical protein
MAWPRLSMRPEAIPVDTVPKRGFLILADIPRTPEL